MIRDLLFVNNLSIITKSMNLKKTILVILSALFSLLIVYWFYSKQSIKKSKEFAFTDTAKIDEMILIRNHQKVYLNKKNNRWYFNNEDKASEESISLLLKTIRQISVKSLVPEKIKDELIAELRKSIEVQILSEDKLIKNYYIGSTTPDLSGTYAMIKSSKKPYIIEIQGITGNIKSRFQMDSSYWKSKKFISLAPDNIKIITLENHQNPNKSFIIKNIKSNLKLYNLSNQIIQTKDSNNLYQYFSMFSDVNFRKILKRDKKNNTISTTNPIYTLTIQQKNNKNEQFIFYPIYENEKLNYNDLYGLNKSKNELFLLNYFDIDPLFKEPDDF